MPLPRPLKLVGGEPPTPPLPENVVVLHPDVPVLSARERARLDLVDLFQGLDPASQRVILSQLESTQATIRRYTPTAAIVRGEDRPVAWRRGGEDLWLVAPASRRFLYQRAMG